MKERVLILHHNDRDGFMSALIVKYSYLKENAKNEIYTREIDYSDSLKTIMDQCEKDYEFDVVYLVDYSISNVENAKEIISIDERYELHWIDHHKSSIKMITEPTSSEYNPMDLDRIDGLRVIGLSGAALCWIYTWHLDDDKTTKLVLDIGDTLFEDYNNQDKEISKMIARLFCIASKMSKFVLYTHRYDIFDLDSSVLHFKYGFDVKEIKDGFDDDEMMLLTESEESNMRFNTVLETGKRIKKYVDENNAYIVEHNAVEYEYEGLSCITVNHTEFNSLTFGNTIADYDFVIVYAKVKNKWRHGIYTFFDSVDCSEIAKRYGGGGHQKAAGFFSEKPFYELDSSFKRVE